MTRTKSNRKFALRVKLSPDVLEAINKFRFERRVPSRAAAVRELLRTGLANVGAARDNAGIISGEYKSPKRRQDL
jgi:hypothetical protein